MKNVYLMDYSQFTRLNLSSLALEDKSLTFSKIRNIIEQQGGLFLETHDPRTLARIEQADSHGIIYQYATNKISLDQFINAMGILFKLDPLVFKKYWESTLNMDNLSTIALQELAKIQQKSDVAIHLTGNLTKLNADWLNVKLALLGLKNIQYTCSFTEGKLVSTDDVNKVVETLYPTTDYNVIDLRNNRLLTPDLLKPNPNNTITTAAHATLVP